MSEQPRLARLRGWLLSKAVLTGFAIFGAGLVFAGVFNSALHFTNTTEFCTSCHTMQTNLEELKEKKTHWNNKSGVHAGCADCHVPKSFAPKMVAKIMAAKDVFHEIMGTINTPEKYDAHRHDMAMRVWAKMKATDSRECRSCHSFDHMNAEEQDKFASRKHAAATKRGETCIDCHKGVAHKLPKEAIEGDKDEDEESDKKDAPEKEMSGMGGMQGMGGMSGMDGMQGMSGMMGMEGMHGMSGMQGMSGMGGMQGMSGMGGMQGQLGMSGMQGMSGMGGMQGQPGMGGMQGMSGMGGMQGMSGMGGMQGQPGMSGMQGMSGMGGMQGQPGMGGMQGQPGMGGMQGMSGMGGMQGTPGMGGMQGR